MIQCITYMESKQTSPYRNLAIEEYLLKSVLQEECILYLWQNKNTVVIGRNQNAWKECLVHKLQDEGGQLVRRLSGGGAVFHDLGNLNFTFLVRKENYDLEKQLQVILIAVQKLGMKAEKSGRNDILIDGRKFSGNAFYETKQHCYHHGTIMVHVNISDLSKYLTVSKEKLKSKGVDSVKSRVTNLSDYKTQVTIEDVKEKMLEAFQEVYSLKAHILKEESLDQEMIQKGTQWFASWEWIFGRKIEFQQELSHQFSWGNLVLQFQIQKGSIQDVAVYSDAMDPEGIRLISTSLRSCKYEKKAICQILELVQEQVKAESKEEILRDVRAWFMEIDI